MRWTTENGILNGCDDGRLTPGGLATHVQVAQLIPQGSSIHFTAECLPQEKGASVLDLGCGTGLELEAHFQLAPTAKVTGIDLAPGMLAELKKKFSNRDINLALGSYFDVPFGSAVYDAAVSVESLSAAGFSSIEVLKHWGATHTIKAVK